MWEMFLSNQRWYTSSLTPQAPQLLLNKIKKSFARIIFVYCSFVVQEVVNRLVGNQYSPFGKGQACKFVIDTQLICHHCFLHKIDIQIWNSMLITQSCKCTLNQLSFSKCMSRIKHPELQDKHWRILKQRILWLKFTNADWITSKVTAPGKCGNTGT